MYRQGLSLFRKRFFFLSLFYEGPSWLVELPFFIAHGQMEVNLRTFARVLIELPCPCRRTGWCALWLGDFLVSPSQRCFCMHVRGSVIPERAHETVVERKRSTLLTCLGVGVSFTRVVGGETQRAEAVDTIFVCDRLSCSAWLPSQRSLHSSYGWTTNEYWSLKNSLRVASQFENKLFGMSTRKT